MFPYDTYLTAKHLDLIACGESCVALMLGLLVAFKRVAADLDVSQ